MHYSKIIIFFYAVVLTIFNVAAQNSCNDKILGRWFAPDKKSTVEFYLEGDSLIHARLDWMQREYENGKLRTDNKNPIDSLKNRLLKGIDLVNNLQCENPNYFVDGKLYDCRAGKIYDCVINLVEDDKLELRGYMYTPIFGKSVYFTRYEEY